MSLYFTEGQNRAPDHLWSLKMLQRIWKGQDYMPVRQIRLSACPAVSSFFCLWVFGNQSMISTKLEEYVRLYSKSQIL